MKMPDSSHPQAPCMVNEKDNQASTKQIAYNQTVTQTQAHSKRITKDEEHRGPFTTIHYVCQGSMQRGISS
jgi:hypothetical protein